MHYPGSTQMGIGRRFFERYPWWRFTPLDDPALPAGRLNAFAAGIPGEVAVYYLPVNCFDQALWGMQREGGDAVITVAATTRYQAHFFNPRNGKTVPIGAVHPDADGRWTSPRKPGMDDWVLVLEREDRAGIFRG